VARPTEQVSRGVVLESPAVTGEVPDQQLSSQKSPAIDPLKRLGALSMTSRARDLDKDICRHHRQAHHDRHGELIE